jgi:hypothetical protein
MTSGARFNNLSPGQFWGICQFLTGVTAIDRQGREVFQQFLKKERELNEDEIGNEDPSFKEGNFEDVFYTPGVGLILRTAEGENTGSVSIKKLNVSGRFLKDEKGVTRESFVDYLPLLKKVAEGENSKLILKEGIRVTSETPYHRLRKKLGAFVREIPDMKPFKAGPEVSASEFLDAKARESDLLEHTLSDQDWEPTFQNKMLIYEHVISPLTASP